MANMIEIMLNGKKNTICKTGMTVSDLLTKWRMRPELVTVELNENILQKLEYDATEIKDGDHVEFVFYMGGGSGLGSLFSDPRISPPRRGGWVPAGTSLHKFGRTFSSEGKSICLGG